MFLLKSFRCDISGRGVFLKENRPKGSFIVEYCGELISATEGYDRESSVDDISVFRFYVNYRGKHWW